MKARFCMLVAGLTIAAAAMARPAAAQGRWGDVNGDGMIGALDAQAILTAAVDLTLPAGYIKTNGDANCDGQVTAMDAQVVLSMVVALPVSQFCVGQPIAAPLTSRAYATGNSSSPVGVIDGGRITAASWTTSGFSRAAFTQSAYVDGGRGTDVRVTYATGDVPSRIYDTKTKESISIVLRNDRADYLFYDAAGQYVSGIAVVWSSPKVSLASINTNPAMTGQLSALSNALSFSVLGKADAGLGPLVGASAKFMDFHNAGLPTSASTATTAFQKRLAQAGLLAIGGASATALGLPSIPQALVAGGLAAVAVSNHPNLHSMTPDAFETTLAKYFEDGMSYGKTPLETVTAALAEIGATGTLAPKDAGKLTAKTGTSTDPVPALVASSGMQAASGGPPAGSSTLDGYAVDKTDVMYTLIGTISSAGQVSATGSPATGSGSVSITGTLTGSSFSGSYSGTPGAGSISGTVTSLGACQTQNSSGGQGTFVKSFNMGATTGDVTFTYEAYSIKDAFKVAHAGEVVLNTGPVSGAGSRSFPLKNSSIVFVTVSAPLSGTAWDFTVECPKPATANTISINAGNNQVAAPGAAVATAPSVMVTNASGAGVSGVSVTFSVATGGGSITGAMQTTDARGIATVGSWVLGSATGTNTLTASAAGATGSPVTFTATAGNGNAIALNDGNNQTAAPGTAVAVAPSVKVTNASGAAVSGVAVTFAVASGGGSITGASQTTNASGIATVGSWTLGSSAGANTLTATAPGVSGSPVTFTATAGVASNTIAINDGDKQAAMVSTALPIVPSVVVKNSSGSPIAGATVTFAIEAGGGTITGPTATTDAGGIARVGSWTLGSVAGPNKLSATISGAAPVTILAAGCAGAGAGYKVTLCITSDLTTTQRSAFTSAATRWEGIISADLPDGLVNRTASSQFCGASSYTLTNFTIDDLLIFVSLESIDGVGSVLGSASPCLIRNTGSLPIAGAMRFDIADVAKLETDGQMNSVILHEMGHVLGIGSLWDEPAFGLLKNPSTEGGPSLDTYYSGTNGIAGFNLVGGATYTGGAKVPVENLYKAGTINSHWRESVLANELMTGFLNTGSNPLSILSIRSLQDMGYTVNTASADPLTLGLSVMAEGSVPGSIQLVNDVDRLPLAAVDALGRVVRIIRR